MNEVKEYYVDKPIEIQRLRQILIGSGVKSPPKFKGAVFYSNYWDTPIAADLYKSKDAKLGHPFVRVALSGWPL